MASFETQVQEILKNELFFYFIAFLFGTNVIGYVALGQYSAIIFMTLIGAIAFHFNDNLAVVMMLCIVLTSLFMLGNKGGREGMEEEEKTDKKEKTKEKAKTVMADDNSGVAATPSTNNNDLVNKKSSAPSVDYATTVQDAYGDISKILGPDGIKGLTTDTKDLISTQKELFDSMNQMAPAVKEAQKMLKSLDISGLDVSGLSKMLGSAQSLK
jgi:hypothetical protein